MDPAVIVFLSFVIFMGIAYRLGYRKSISALDQKIATIRQTLEEATKAKEEALQALQAEQRHYEEILEEIDVLTKRTEEQAHLLQEQAMQDINNMIATRQQTVENMIDRMRSAAIQTLQEQVAAKATDTFKWIVTNEFSSPQQQALNDGAIHQIMDQLTQGPRKYTQKPKRARTKRSLAR